MTIRLFHPIQKFSEVTAVTISAVARPETSSGCYYAYLFLLRNVSLKKIKELNKLKSYIYIYCFFPLLIYGANI